MKTLRLLFNAAIIETLGIALAAWVLLAASGHAATHSDTSNQPAPAHKSWFAGLDFWDASKLPPAEQRRAAVQTKLESTADKMASLVAHHFDGVVSSVFSEELTKKPRAGE